MRHKLLTVLLLSLTSAAHAMTYQVTRVAAPGFSFSVEALNDLGQVAGISFANSGSTGFLWDPVTGTTEMGGLTQDGFTYGLNNQGQVVGYRGFQGFVWTQSTGFTDLGMLPGAFDSKAFAINNSGTIVGSSSPAGSFIQNIGPPGSVPPVPPMQPLPAGFSAADINDNNQVAGRNGVNHAALLAPDGTLQDLGALSGDLISGAFGMNELGHVVGTSTPDFNNLDVTRAFIWKDSTAGIAELSALEPEHDNVIAQALNDAGQAVGFSADSGGTITPRAVLWDAEGAVHDLNDLIDPTDPLANIIDLSTASDINQQGQILASGSLNFFELGVFVLTPVPVPLPAGLWLLGSAISLLGLGRLRQA